MAQPDVDRNGPARFPHQCAAKSSNTGLRCGAPAMSGQTVCRVHGGGTKTAKAKAQRRLLELVDPAIATLAREMVRAEKSADRQRAANSILDRAGVPRSTAIADADAARDLLVDRIRTMREQAGITADTDPDPTGDDAALTTVPLGPDEYTDTTHPAGDDPADTTDKDTP